MTRLPRWSDEKAVAKKVADEIEDGRSEIEFLWANYPNGNFPNGKFPLPKHLWPLNGLIQDEWARGWPIDDEEGAVAAALRGDTEPLAELLRPRVNPPEFELPDEVNPAIKTLSPATWSIIADLVTGKLNPRTGRGKGQPGRPRMSREERRARNPIHDAADEFLVIKSILRHHYPRQSVAQINLRAEKIAQDRARIATSVLNLRGRTRKTGHRA